MNDIDIIEEELNQFLKNEVMYYPDLKQSDSVVQKISELKLNLAETKSQFIDYIKFINFD